MGTPSEEFREERNARFSRGEYPPAFLAQYDVIECLSSSQSGETLLVTKRGENEYLIAKIVDGAEFDAECALLNSLSHPGLPKLYEQITDTNTHILIRSFVEGKPLNEVIAERSMSPSEIINISTQLCDILTYLHTQTPPVIHRDVKPQNVILGPDGNVTLIDFGIARTYKQDAVKDTVFSGTNDFAPPEQYGFSQTDARADIYALGMLLKYLLTKGDLNAKIEDGRLRRIVRRCTAFAPSSRYKSALSVKRALLSLRRKTKAVCALAAALLLALGAGFLTGRYAFPYVHVSQVSFIEPVIERAVRMTLDKPTGALTKDDLMRVRELYIFQNTPYTKMQDYHDVLMEWFASGLAIQNGSVKTLADLPMLPNLTTLVMAGEPITDLSPLAECPALEVVELSNLHASDITPLASLPKLRALRLVGMTIPNILPLEQLDRLTVLDLTSGNAVYNPATLANMGDFTELSVIGSAAAHLHLSGKHIGRLSVSYGGITDISSLSGVTGLWNLDLSNTKVSDLHGIEAHDGLNTLNIAHTQVMDLSPLLAFQNLTELVLSEDMDVDTSMLSGMEGLTIRYE